jgi:hypothetical protein
MTRENTNLLRWLIGISGLIMGVAACVVAPPKVEEFLANGDPVLLATPGQPGIRAHAWGDTVQFDLSLRDNGAIHVVTASLPVPIPGSNVTSIIPFYQYSAPDLPSNHTQVTFQVRLVSDSIRDPFDQTSHLVDGVFGLEPDTLQEFHFEIRDDKGHWTERFYRFIVTQ